jgi:hypothetical protein
VWCGVRSGRTIGPVVTAFGERRVGNDAGGDAVTTQRRWQLDLRFVAPICAATLYVAVVALRLPALLSSYYSYSDFPEALRLGDAVFHGGYGHGLAVPSQSGLGPLWVVGLVNQITGSEVAAMAFGAVLLLLIAGFMTWTAQRVLGARGAVAVAALCIATPPVVAWEFLSPIAHESTLLMTVVFAWQLVALSRGLRGSGIASSFGVGALAGICVTSDPLVVAAAMVPWIICAVVFARSHRDARLPLLLTLCAAIAIAVLIDIWAATHHIVEQSNTGFAASIQGIADGLRTTVETLGQMFSGAWYSDVLVGAVAFAGLTLFLGVVYMASRVATGARDEAPSARAIYCCFWLLSSAGIVGAFCISGLGIQHSPVNYQGHYVDGIWFALAALLPTALITGWKYRGLVVAGVTCLALVSAAGIARVPAYPFQGPDYVDSAQLTRTLDQLGLTHGYGGYWESYAVGWRTSERVTALPLQQCRTTAGAQGLCRYEFAAPAWYQAQAGPIFVIVLRAPCSGDDLCIGASNLEGLAPPDEIRNVGLLQVYVYAHDVFAGLPMASRS